MQVKGNQAGIVRRANAVVRARKCAGDTKKYTKRDTPRHLPFSVGLQPKSISLKGLR